VRRGGPPEPLGPFFLPGPVARPPEGPTGPRAPGRGDQKPPGARPPHVPPGYRGAPPGVHSPPAIMAGLRRPPRGSIFLAVALLLVVLIAAAWAGHSASHRHLGWACGVWAGDPSWMREAQVSDFVLFIGPRDPAGESQGYLRIVGDDGAVVTSQALTLRARPPGWARALRAALARRPGSDTVAFRCALEFDDAGSPIPDRVTFSLSPLDGTLALLDEKKVYAFLSKDLYSSSVALQAYGAP